MLSDFETSIACVLNDFQKTTEYKFKNKCTTNVIHNHVPVRFIVKGCPYCELYGNCFSKDS